MPNYYALLPAAGTGSRMGAATPKQYLDLLGRPLIYHALKPLCDYALIQRVFVVLSPEDRHFLNYDWREFGDKLCPLYVGGSSRAESVRNGLHSVQDRLHEQDWILVHDAARPCLNFAQLVRLVAVIDTDPVGGLLAVPVADTLKLANTSGRVAATHDRTGLWQAQTPQMFRYGLLNRALQQINLTQITDEASAIEALGFAPKLVESDGRNLKVTYPQDAALAALLLEQERTQTNAS